MASRNIAQGFCGKELAGFHVFIPSLPFLFAAARFRSAHPHDVMPEEAKLGPDG
jgi:hypothetical protein